jgi:RNA-binding protein YlmH
VWSEQLAEEALLHFESVIQKKNKPENIVEINLTNLLDVVKTLRKCSTSEARRLIEYKGVKVNDVTVDVEKSEVKVGDIVKVGKLHFAKIV